MRLFAPVAVDAAVGAFLDSGLLTPRSVSNGYTNVKVELWGLWVYNGYMVKKKATTRQHSAALHIRLRPEHDKLIREAAAYLGVSLSDWCRLVLIRAAREEIREKAG